MRGIWLSREIARRYWHLFSPATTLFTFPVRRALVEEGVHPLAKILAHIGAKDQILALLARQRSPDAAHRLFCHFERDRRVACNKPCGLLGAALQRCDIGHHFVE